MKIDAVLVVDDNAALRHSMQRALEGAGYRVRLAANGKEALAVQAQNRADVLITDIFMPEADGFETIRHFRAAFPATRILAMSGGSTRAKGDYLRVAALLGVDATLRKPFGMDALLEALRSLETV